MKAFGASVLLAAAAHGASTYQKDLGQNGTNGQMARLSALVSTSVFDLTGVTDDKRDLQWVIEHQSVFYEDSGEEKLRMTHKLTANLFATDVVEFELSYRSKSTGVATSNTVLGEDFYICKMSQSSSDNAFWDPDISDGYYTCSTAVSGPSDFCAAGTVTEPVTYTAETQSASAWTAPFKDDDWENPWCTKAYSKSMTTYTPFECTQLICTVERLMDTGKPTEDIKFDPTHAGGEAMTIKRGRAMLRINASKQTYFQNAVATNA